jgi:hypothetical protein
MIGSSIARKYWTRVKATDSQKHSRLLQYVIHCSLKEFDGVSNSSQSYETFCKLDCSIVVNSLSSNFERMKSLGISIVCHYG